MLTEAGAATVPAQTGRLLRILGVAFGLAVIIGNTIVAGILRTPGQIAELLPSPTLFLAVWVAGGAYALLGAVSMAELGAMIPRSGGQYVFVRRALGAYPGFIVGWSDWISTCATVSASAIVMGEYTASLIPGLRSHPTLIAVAAVLGILALQWRGIRWGDVAQQFMSSGKALALLAVVVAAFTVSARAAQGPVSPPLPEGFALFAALMIALQSVIYTYDGWTGVIYFGEEVQDPGRDIPRSMIGGVLLVIAIYLLINLAYLRVLPISRMAGDPFVAGAVANEIFGAQGDTVIRGIMAFSLLGGINALLLMASRVPLALGRDGLLTRGVTGVNRGGTPTGASLASTAIALGFILSGTFNQVLALAAFFFVANYTLSFLSVFVLRRREPEAPRPYRAWGYPWTTGLVLLGSIAFLVGQVVSDTRTSAWSLALLALSYPAFGWVKRRRAA